MEKKPEATPIKPLHLGKIETLQFNNVSFKHQTAGQNAITSINFNVKVGETVAFVGPSGSGKTTLVKLLVGLYQPVEGEVFYNKISGKEIDLDQLREKIGFVTQCERRNFSESHPKETPEPVGRIFICSSIHYCDGCFRLRNDWLHPRRIS